MRKKITVTILLASLFFTSCTSQSSNKPNIKEESSSLEPTTLVSHAAGSIYGYTYTNSLEALEKSYEDGFELVEIDFNWTSDDELVCIHDWESMAEKLFMREGEILSLEEFKAAKTFQDLTLMSLEDLADWLRENPDIYIVTDIKIDNIEALKLIKESYKDIQDRFVPQIYNLEEYDPVKDMGYENIILTLYGLDLRDDEIIDFIETNPLFALTIPGEEKYFEFVDSLKDFDLFIYAHTINTLAEFEILHSIGVSGIYTDHLQADQFPEEYME